MLLIAIPTFISFIDSGYSSLTIYSPAFQSDRKKIVSTIFEKMTSFKSCSGSPFRSFRIDPVEIKVYNKISSGNYTVKQILDFFKIEEASGVILKAIIKLLKEKFIKERKVENIADAVLLGNLDAVKDFIEKGVSANYKIPETEKHLSGLSILMAAIKLENDEIAEYLVGMKNLRVEMKCPEGKTALLHAIEKKSTAIIRLLIEKKADVSAKNNNNYTALMMAASKGEYDVVELLVEKGADVNARNNLGQTAIVSALRFDHLDTIRALIFAKAELIDIDGNNNDATYFAESEDARQLVSNGMELFAQHKKPSVEKKSDGKTLDVSELTRKKLKKEKEKEKNLSKVFGIFIAASVLIVAAMSIHYFFVPVKAPIYEDKLENESTTRTVEEDLGDVPSSIGEQKEKYSQKYRVRSRGKTGVEAVAPDRKGLKLQRDSEDSSVPYYKYIGTKSSGSSSNSATVDKGAVESRKLLEAIESNDVKTVENLLSGDVSPDSRDKDNYSALHLAIRKRDMRVINALINAGAGVDNLDPEGYTLLSYAINENDKKMVKYLLNKGADPNKFFGGGNLPLVFASERGFSEIALILIENEAEIDKSNSYEMNPLRAALFKNKWDTAEMLLQNDADINARNSNGYTALMLAAYGGNREIAKFLIKKGADIDLAMNEVWTALKIAEKRDHEKVVELLKDAGAK